MDNNIEMKPATFQRKISSNIMKDKILITQLGKGGYKDTIYVYPDNNGSKKTGYAFDAVVDKENPNKLLLIGTSGSGWSGVLDWYSLGLSNERRIQADEIRKKTIRTK